MPKAKPKLRTTAAKSASVYTLKVELRDQPDIWRRIEIRGNQTLEHLHEAIVEAFDREEEHLYSFYFAPPGRQSRPDDSGILEYTHPDVLDEAAAWDDEGAEPTVFDAAGTRIDSLGLNPRRKFDYRFDFGDCWDHVITVERIDGVPEKKTDYPRIVERNGESPPQYPDFDEGEGANDSLSV